MAVNVACIDYFLLPRRRILQNQGAASIMKNRIRLRRQEAH